MKVKELIKALRKNDPDDYIYVEMDLDENGTRGAANLKRVKNHSFCVLLVT